MSVLSIPVLSGTEQPFVQETDLDGRVYTLAFRFNVRDEKWRLTFRVDGVFVLLALVLVIGEDLFSESRHIEELPPGNLIVRDLEGLDRDPDGENFGDTVLLLYDYLT